MWQTIAVRGLRRETSQSRTHRRSAASVRWCQGVSRRRPHIHRPRRKGAGVFHLDERKRSRPSSAGRPPRRSTNWVLAEVDVAGAGVEQASPFIYVNTSRRITASLLAGQAWPSGSHFALICYGHGLTSPLLTFHSEAHGVAQMVWFQFVTDDMAW